jgi:hypothetical protein
MSKQVESATDRREFIKLSTGALLTVTLANGTDLRANPVVGPGSVVSIGFWQGVPTLARRYSRASAAFLSAAESIPTGDPAFFRTAARVSVRGMWRPERLHTQPSSHSLDVLYDQGGEKVPFMAWSHRVSQHAPVASNRLSFNVPVDALGTVDLVVASGSRRQQIRFTVNSQPDAINLRPGYYFIAFREDGDPAIDWSRIMIRDGALPKADLSGSGVLATSDILAVSDEVPFSYLVLRVDVARDTSAAE